MKEKAVLLKLYVHIKVNFKLHDIFNDEFVKIITIYFLGDCYNNSKSRRQNRHPIWCHVGK